MTETRQPQTKGTEMSNDLARQLRAAGRDDLAGQLERGTTDGLPADPNEQFLREIQAKSQGQWISTPAFGDVNEDEQAATIAAGLDRDIPGWRG